YYSILYVNFFFFQAEDGIRVFHVTGVQTCALPIFATIFVQQTGTGTVSNEEGSYEFKLPSGTYEIVYQYLGYETQVRTVDVADDYVTINITMKVQTTVLRPVTVEAGNEDPAYTIM